MTLSRLLTLALVALSILGGCLVASASDLDLHGDPLAGSDRPGYVDTFAGFFGGYFVSTTHTGEKGIQDISLRVAGDAKNVIILICGIYLLIIVLKLLFSHGTEEDLKHWRGGIIWTTVAIVILQSSYSIINTLYNLDIGTQGQYSGVLVLNNVIYPFIKLMEYFVAFIFIGMMIFAFYKIVTAQGEEDKIKKGKREIFYLLFGFLGVKISDVLVTTVYGKIDTACIGNALFVSTNCILTKPDVSAPIQLMTTIIMWLNGFLFLLILLLFMWAGFLVLTSGHSEENIKKAKNIFKYSIIGLLLLASSLLIFQFFIFQDVGGSAALSGQH